MESLFTKFQTQRDRNKCKGCWICQELVNCQADFKEAECLGCGACVLICPREAIKIVEGKREKEIKIEVNGKIYNVPEKITVKKALEELGYKFTKFPKGDFFAPCEVGGCYSCAVIIEEKILPSCITGVKEGMIIKTEFPDDFIPKRIVGGFTGHLVGGVGTPWHLKGDSYIETAMFTAGCNLRCPQCQNWTTTYRGKERFDYFEYHRALTPKEAAFQMTLARAKYAVNRMAISGGECTLNRKWLIQYLKALREFNQDRDARFHVDTNGSLLTKDYIDELVEAGMTDIGIDLKGLKIETFMRITGLEDEKLAEVYKENAWEAIQYITENYRDKVFMGVGIPYNKSLISLEEIEEMGKGIAKIDPETQVCPLDYRPEFKRQDIVKPDYQEMKKVYEVLKGVGLKTVVCQTEWGYIGP
jgi:pyruvate formate lyase activating enzyme